MNSNSDFRVSDLVEILSGKHKGKFATVLQTKSFTGLESSYISVSLEDDREGGASGLCVVARADLRLIERTEVKTYRKRYKYND